MLDFSPALRMISVQTGGTDVCDRLANVLVWAYTLSDVTAQWWHTPEHSLHVTIAGRTAGGTRMRVYTGGSFAACHGLVSLKVDESEDVSLDELYALVGLLREATRNAQHEREAA